MMLLWQRRRWLREALVQEERLPEQNFETGGVGKVMLVDQENIEKDPEPEVLPLEKMSVADFVKYLGTIAAELAKAEDEYDRLYDAYQAGFFVWMHPTLGLDEDLREDLYEEMIRRRRKVVAKLRTEFLDAQEAYVREQRKIPADQIL